MVRHHYILLGFVEETKVKIAVELCKIVLPLSYIVFEFENIQNFCQLSVN